MADDLSLVRCALDLGVTVFDTADVYGSGASEHVLGRALRGRRDEVTVATKGGFVFRARRPGEQWARRQAKGVIRSARSFRTGSVAPGGSAVGSGSYAVQDFSPGHLRAAVHASLRRLGTDRVDVYQLHGPEELFPDLFDELTDLVSVGDVVRFGVGAGSTESADAWCGVRGLQVVQVPFGVLDPEAASSTLPLASDHGLEVWARGALGGGLIGIAEQDPTAVADHRKRSLVVALRDVANESGLDPFHLALGFVRAKGVGVSTVLVGTSSSVHLARNVAALTSPPLPSDVTQRLTELVDTSIEHT
jgi:aryl-alcohol dehydrogenase-like predicted oxidoreductase